MRLCSAILLHMNVFQKVIVIAFLGIAVISSAVMFQRITETPCTTTIHYTIGTFDNRFQLSQNEFHAAIAEARAIWEEPFEHDFFTFNSNADFTINLIFDERQQLTLEEQTSRDILKRKSVQQDTYLSEYEMLKVQYRIEVKKYETQLQVYERELQKYNDTVSRWNSRSGAPPIVYKELHEERLRLEDQLTDIEMVQINLNQLTDKINSIARENNQFVEEYNTDIITYNNKFGSSRQFDQGDYQGDRINIYQFESKSDLRLALAHELGHALSLQHVDDQKAIMYYLMGKQDIFKPSLTPSDVEALKNRCGL